MATVDAISQLHNVHWVHERPQVELPPQAAALQDMPFMPGCCALYQLQDELSKSVDMDAMCHTLGEQPP